MPAAEYPPRNANSQTTRALLELRELILSGELRPDERLSELAIVDRLGVSRTPVRAALLRLSQEGLLDDLPGGGFAVKSFTERDVHDAIELQGTLEGMAGRFAAERGAAPLLIAEARDVVAQIDAIIDGVGRNQADFDRYVELNERFHSLLIRMSGSDLLAREFERMTRLPFASPSGFVRAQALAPESRLILTIAQEQHRAVLEAIEMRQGERAEGVMREHARLAHRNLRYALSDGDAIRHVRGGGLIRNEGDSAAVQRSA